jgi:hypothetical protein
MSMATNLPASSDEEAAAFDAALAEQRRVDPEFWG